MRVYFEPDVFEDQIMKNSISVINTLSYLDYKGILSGTLKTDNNLSFIDYLSSNERLTINSFDKDSCEIIIGIKERNLKNYFQIKKEGDNYDFISLKEYLTNDYRFASVNRKTNETDIEVKIWLDNPSVCKINTNIGFFNHMLEQIARHSNIGIYLNATGDLYVDEHHLVEDVGIIIGESINKALRDKKGIMRYGYSLPMDDSSAECLIDLGGRPYLNFAVDFRREKVGELPTELVEEFFKSLAFSMKANLKITANGKNDHHKIEAIFKAFARALNMALKFDERNENKLPTTKGLL